MVIEMYILAPGIKADLVKHWALPDRVFFASGACHILAYAFLDAYPTANFRAVWIKPKPGFTGNHIVAVRGDTAFDYHGYAGWSGLLEHMRVKANRWWPGWTAELVPLPKDVLVSEMKSRQYDRLWLREPGQYLHDAMPRAQQFLLRFPRPD